MRDYNTHHRFSFQPILEKTLFFRESFSLPILFTASFLASFPPSCITLPTFQFNYKFYISFLVVVEYYAASFAVPRVVQILGLYMYVKVFQFS